MNILRANEQNTYDAIVVGSGISGGWAAKELTEKGLKTLVLERGRKFEHVTDYENALKKPWELTHRGRITNEERASHPFLSRDYPYGEANKTYWFNDSDAPYSELKRFDWYRPNIVGGKSIMWGRQSYRLSDLDFEANLKEGIGTDWPVRYAEIAPWYSYVEKFVGVSGSKDGLPQLPDGEFLPPMQMNCAEQAVKKGIEGKFPNRVMTIGRVANLTQAGPAQQKVGRGPCQYRNLCSLGCPYGGYFSSPSATIPAAMATKRLTIRPNSIASEIIYDSAAKKAKGVRIVDSETNEVMEFFAKVIFVCGGAIGTTALLLNSTSDRFPNGFGNDSGQLGHNLMDHHFRTGASGIVEGLDDKYYFGRRANGIYIPRYRNVGNDKRDYVRGFGYQGGGSRQGWNGLVAEMGFGAELKEKATKPGPWSMNLGGFGETLPAYENRMFLDKDKKDKWGLPTVVFDADLRENEKKMRKDMMNDAAEMLEAAGVKNVRTFDNGSYLGMAIHEMGTARMGRDPKTSVLNGNNQVWDAKNVFVTDGAFMASAGCQNPSLTYMAFTARAVDFAVKELKKKNL
ncbi:GMC family oxidoreductase [Siphonobacter sp. BAB-5385]|uniref:GMC oxidoreductase n=1 Tax=Siphonobacter sp. BAB-5385 TaxID=1864822 RepID=UPI000B9E2F1D|nr:GMC family oxidoreductase [Siphonobacter sp. BAB-5385]OZI06202.1 GMC family oxidoreductase [Siphonobacter sp. BAB-5385]